MSVVFAPFWDALRHHLACEIYDKDGGHVDPRIRIEFRDVPVALAEIVRMWTMPCVTCDRPIFPLRRREGSTWENLYYAPSCPIGIRTACARSAPAREEYERFKDLWAQHPRPKSPQLSLFY